MVIRTFLILLAAVFCWSSSAAETNQILFLRLKLKDGTVSLVESTTRPGLLKSPRSTSKKRPLQFALETAAGQPLWEQSIDDPTVVRLETADPDSGEIKPVIIERGEAEFTVRVPVTQGMSHVAFYREEKKAAADGTSPAKIDRKLIGKISLSTP